jgi:hypothetical protein
MTTACHSGRILAAEYDDENVRISSPRASQNIVEPGMIIFIIKEAANEMRLTYEARQ